MSLIDKKQIFSPIIGFNDVVGRIWVVPMGGVAGDKDIKPPVTGDIGDRIGLAGNERAGGP